MAASLTDYLDGYLARRTHAITRFGRIVDPLADRLLINMAVILLAYGGRLPWLLAVPQLVRDAYLAILFERRKVATEVQVTMTGKVATALIMVLAGADDADHERDPGGGCSPSAWPPRWWRARSTACARRRG